MPPRKATAATIALCNARSHAAALAGVAIALNAEGAAADWVHLLPAGAIETLDGRGPYRVADAAKLVAQSLKTGDRLPIDENHAIDIAAPKGGASPARGWMVELQARADGIWARVEWTREGAALLADRAYRHISPVITHLKDGTVTQILRAALTNSPNLRELVALNREGADMDLLAKLREALGLAAEATEEAILAAIKELKGAAPAAQAALQSVAKAAGLKAEAKPAEVETAVVALAAKAKGGEQSDQLKALQTELSGVTKQLNELRDAGAKEKAEAFVDGAIKKGHVGVKPLRDHYIARHMTEPGAVEKEIAALPILGPSGAAVTPPAKDGEVSLNAEQKQAAKLLGIPEKDYAATLKTEREKEEVL